MQTLFLNAPAALLVGAGVAHFVQPSVSVPLVPLYLPRPLLLVYLSGAAEVGGGIGVQLQFVLMAWGYGAACRPLG